MNIGNVRKDQGRLDDALAAYGTALRLKPEAAHVHSNVIFTLNYHPRYDARAIQEECARWNRLHAEPLKKSILPHSNRPDPKRRLRIGYVSPDFREHVDSHFTIPLLSNHDHRQFEIFCYASVVRPDHVTQRLRGYADVWRHTVGLTDQQIADLVRSDEIDILVDLKLHTANNRLLLFARKPAPLQVTWLAYPGTSGLPAIDYRLTDPYLDPPGLFDAFYVEESFRLPETFWCYDPLTDQPTVNALPAMTNGAITFGCLNTFCKVNDDCLALWAGVLQAVPQSRLLLHAPKDQARERVLAKLEQAGIAASRVEFADRQPRQDYLRLYHRIDMALDPLPYNGGTTSLDAFWMGVPTLTLRGKTVVGRAGWSQLSNLGLQELAADTPEQYVALTARLAGDLPRLQKLRSTLRQRMLRSPLMDGKRFAGHMEQAYRQMWHKWCQQTQPAGSGSAIPPDRAISGPINEPASSSVRPTLDVAWQYYQRGQLQQAEQLYLQILEGDPHQVDALHLLAVIAGQTGRESRAIDYLKAVLRLQPGLAAAHNNLGNAYVATGKLPEAMASYQEAVRLQPDYAVAHNNLGNALRAQGRLAEAVASLERALGIQPDYAEAQHNLGIALQEQGRLAEAVASFQQVLRLKPDHADAHFGLGVALEKQGNLEDAAASYQQTLHLQPHNVEAGCNFGNVLRDQGRLDEAIAAYRAALLLQPGRSHIHSNLILLLHYHPGYDARAIFEECRRWDQQHAEPLKRFILPHANLPDAERRLRIGYVSPDFRDHVDSFFTVPLLSNHDHGQFEIFCYSHVARPDALTERLRGYADVWRSTVGLSDQQVADLVRSDRIDILIDLKLHTGNNQLRVFARKPAPVQVVWLGYPGTSGMTAFDYRLTDPYLDPPGLFDAFCSEETQRLPDTFWCYDSLTDQPPVNGLPAAQNGFVTFGCLNNFCKVNDGCLVLWAKVLQAVPRSRLLLRAPRGRAREQVLARLQQEGIALARVDFVDQLPRQEYLKLYHRIDLGLDPLPYNSHTTSLDAFWMGVPTLTLLGKTTVGRAGWSQLSNLGLQELAAQTPEQYVTLAARLAADLSGLQDLRSTLRERMLRSPLMDGKRFARHVEQAYRQMWRKWCLQSKPAEVGPAISPDQPLSAQAKVTPSISVPQSAGACLSASPTGQPPPSGTALWTNLAGPSRACRCAASPGRDCP